MSGVCRYESYLQRPASGDKGDANISRYVTPGKLDVDPVLDYCWPVRANNNLELDRRLPRHLSELPRTAALFSPSIIAQCLCINLRNYSWKSTLNAAIIARSHPIIHAP